MHHQYIFFSTKTQANFQKHLKNSRIKSRFSQLQLIWSAEKCAKNGVTHLVLNLEVNFGAENGYDGLDALDFVECHSVWVEAKHHLEASSHAGKILVLSLKLVFEPSQVELQIRPLHHLPRPGRDFGDYSVRIFHYLCSCFAKLYFKSQLS